MIDYSEYVFCFDYNFLHQHGPRLGTSGDGGETKVWALGYPFLSIKCHRHLEAKQDIALSLLYVQYSYLREEGSADLEDFLLSDVTREAFFIN
jgi:hypothetical protein